MQIGELEYLKPARVDEAIELLAATNGRGLPLAGGMSLLPDLHLGTKRPNVIVSLSKVAGLREVSHDGPYLRIGAMITHRMLATDGSVACWAPSLSDAAGGLGDVQVRNRGTIGGSLANAHPGADAATVLASIGAEVVLRGPEGDRRVAASEFVIGTRSTLAHAAELVTAVLVPHHPGARMAYLRYSRIQGNYSTVNAAALLTDDGGRVAIGGATHRPVVVELPLPLRRAGDKDALDALAAATRAACVGATDDHMASSEYRQALAGVLARRVALSALTREKTAREAPWRR